MGQPRAALWTLTSALLLLLETLLHESDRYAVTSRAYSFAAWPDAARTLT
jgi:hypothetical protein